MDTKAEDDGLPVQSTVTTDANPNPFKWFCAQHSDSESWHGAFDSRDEAVAEGLLNYDIGFWIVEANKAVPSAHIFDAGSVLEDFEESNVECWGEDGAEINYNGNNPDEVSASKRLEQYLGDALAKWLKEEGVGQIGWAFGEQRNSEYIAPLVQQAAPEPDPQP